MSFFMGKKTTNKGDVLQKGTILGGGGTQKSVNFICTINVYNIYYIYIYTTFGGFIKVARLIRKNVKILRPIA